ncbi:MAG: response regulator transcription factor [Chloroflexota bacterium]
MSENGSKPEPIRVLLADDHALIREAVGAALKREHDIELVGEAANGREAVEMAERCRPQVILMDLNMPDIDGIEATRTIVQRMPGVKVLILTAYAEDQYAFDAVKAGARGYVEKTAGLQALVHSIRLVHEGRALVSADIAMRALEEFRQMPTERRGGFELSEREKIILRLLSRGSSNQEIARQMGLSEKTIENRMSAIFQKLRINNRVQAALYALRSGLASLDSPSSDGGGNPPPARAHGRSFPSSRGTARFIG